MQEAGNAFCRDNKVSGRRDLPNVDERDAEFTAQAADAPELCRLLKETGAETEEMLSVPSEANLVVSGFNLSPRTDHPLAAQGRSALRTQPPRRGCTSVDTDSPELD